MVEKGSHAGLQQPEISILKISELRDHEETMPNLTQQLAETIEREGIQRDPIVADSGTNMVLDGTHRKAALERLGCDKVAAWTVDFHDPSVKVSRWTRCLRGLNCKLLIEELFSNITFTWTPLGKADRITADILSPPSGFQILTRNSLACALDLDPNDLFATYELVGLAEKQLAVMGCEITYESEDAALAHLLAGEADVLLVPPLLSKDVVVRLAVEGKLLPPKSTKHSFPHRPLGVNIPLQLLKANNSLEAASNAAQRLLSGRRVRLLQPGPVIRGRRYDEAVWLYEA